MRNVVMLALATAAISLLSVTGLVAYAEQIPTPLQQVQSGVPVHEVECVGERVLVVSPSGMPACVFPDSVALLEQRWFEMPQGEPSDQSAIRASDVSSSGEPSIGPDPEVSISRLPSIGETATFNVTYTNTGLDIDARDYSGWDQTGWRVLSGFEIVNAGGMQYERVNYTDTDKFAYTYTQPTPLEIGESITYIIEVRAIKTGVSQVVGYGYHGESAGITMYIDDEETLLLDEYLERKQAADASAGRSSSDEPEPEPEPEPLTKEEAEALAAKTQVEPTHEEVLHQLSEYVQSSHLSIEWALDNFLPPNGVFNMTDVRQILLGAGFTDEEINGVVSQRASTQSNSTGS